MNSLDKMEDYDRLAQENAELRVQLAAANKRIEDAEKQEPVASVISSGYWNLPLLEWASADHSLRTLIGTKLYAAPIPSPDVAELQRKYEELSFKYSDAADKIVELTRKLAEQQALLENKNKAMSWAKGELEEYLKDIGGCDHSVGICMCSFISAIGDFVYAFESTSGTEELNKLLVATREACAKLADSTVCATIHGVTVWGTNVGDVIRASIAK